MVKKMENKGNEIIDADNSALLDKKMKRLYVKNMAPPMFLN